MEEETTVTEGQEETQSTEVDEQETETTEDSEKASEETDGGSEESESASTEDDEYTDDADAWLGQYRERGLPDGIKSPDDLAAAYLATLPEMKKGQTAAQRLAQIDAALKARGITGGVDAITSGHYELPQKSEKVEVQEGKSYFNTTAARATLAEMEKGGMFRGEQGPVIKQQYEAVADFVDRAFGSELKKAEEVYTTLAKNIVSMQQQMREFSWGQFQHPQKKTVEKGVLDKLMDDIPGLGSYPQAMNWYLLNANPELIAQLGQAQQRIGEEKGLKKFKGKFKTGIKGSHSGGGAPIWKGYISDGGEVDDVKLNRLPPGKAAEILKAYEKKTGKRL